MIVAQVPAQLVGGAKGGLAGLVAVLEEAPWAWNPFDAP